MNWLPYYVRDYYVNKNYYDLMGSVLICLSEISKWCQLCRSKSKRYKLHPT